LINLAQIKDSIMNPYFQHQIQAIPCSGVVNKLTRRADRVVWFNITTIPNIKYQQPAQPIHPIVFKPLPILNSKMVPTTFDKKGLPVFAPLIFVK
jgi:UDP-galactopyranose mutase